MNPSDLPPRPDRRREIRAAVGIAVILAAALAPGMISSGSALMLLRLPIEAILLLAALALVRPLWARRLVAGCGSAAIVLAALAALLDRVFVATLGRSFDPSVLWSELAHGYGAVQDSIGAVAAAGILVVVMAIATGLVVAVATLLLRSTAAIQRRRPRGLATLAGAAGIWILLAASGLASPQGAPLAAADVAGTAAREVSQAATATQDRVRFAAELADDPYASTPAAELLSGLRGKDVVIAFVESYGEVAIRDSSLATGVNHVLREGSARLTAAGYQQRSALLTSPTFGGVSWLAHSTLQSGTWIDSQRRYDQATVSTRRTLSSIFHDEGWRTVSVVPANTRDWPEARSFYRYDSQLNSTNMGYRGPQFSYARIPDQYSLWAFHQKELVGADAPLMAEIDLVSSHTPWTPLPKMVPWETLGDGSVYDPQPAQGVSPGDAWQSPARVQRLYGESIEYSLNSLFSYLTTFDNPDLVLIVVGDHQPASIVSGENAGRDVPISVISRDPSVIARIEAWGWEDGTRPSAQAPRWRMDEFRDRFLSAFSDRPAP